MSDKQRCSTCGEDYWSRTDRAMVCSNACHVYATPTTPTAEAVVRLNRALDKYDEGDMDPSSFARQVRSDLRTLLAAYADAARDREMLQDGLPCYCPKCGSCGEVGCCGMKCHYLPEHTESLRWYEGEIERLVTENTQLSAALDAAREGR